MATLVSGEKSSLLRQGGDDDDDEGDGVYSREVGPAVPMWTKLGFAMGGPPNQITHTLVGFQLNFFLLTVVKIQPKAVGFIVVLGRFWDGLMDPFVGVMTTRTRSRWGSLKPWIAGSIAPLALSYVAIWSAPPWWSDDARAGFVTIAYLIYQLTISMYYIPYTALTVHLSSEQREIDSATMFRMIAETLAVFLGAVLTKIIQPIIDDAAATCEGAEGKGFCSYSSTQLAYISQSAIVAVICILSGVSVLNSVSEQITPIGAEKPRDSVSKGLWVVFRTKSFRRLTYMFLWVWMGVAVMQTNFLLFNEIVLEKPLDVATDLLLTQLGTCVLSGPLWFISMERFGKKNTFIMALCMLLPLVFSLYGVDELTPEPSLHFTFALIGFATSAVYLVPAAMIPDVIADATLRDNGERREALFYSFSVFFQKLGAGLAIYGSNKILEEDGKYDSSKPDNSQAKETLRSLTASVPGSLIFISILFAFFYPLTPKKERRIYADLAALAEAQRAAADAVQSNALSKFYEDNEDTRPISPRNLPPGTSVDV